MAQIKLHPFQEDLLKMYQDGTAKIRFLDNDISSMYTHTITNFFEKTGTWEMDDFLTLDKLRQEDLEAAFISNHPKLLWSTPAAVASNIFAREEQLQEELAWIQANTKSCVILANCPFMRQHTFLFMDWDDALAFKLAWIDK